MHETAHRPQQYRECYDEARYTVPPVHVPADIFSEGHGLFFEEVTKIVREAYVEVAWLGRIVAVAKTAFTGSISIIAIADVDGIHPHFHGLPLIPHTQVHRIEARILNRIYRIEP